MKRHYRWFATLASSILLSGATALAGPSMPSTQARSAPETPSPTRQQGAMHDDMSASMDDAKAIRFTAVAVRPSPPTEPVEIRLSRWSTDTEREQMVDAYDAAKTPAAFATALRALPVVGSIRSRSGRGEAIRFAQKVAGPDKTDRLILVTDQPVAYWQPHTTPNMTHPSYTLIEVHLAPDASGEGWVSYGQGDLKVDDATHALRIANTMGKAPQLLDVKRLDAGGADRVSRAN